MSSRKIGAVTFDLWDCLFADDSDESKREAAGRPPKPIERRKLVHTVLNNIAPIDPHDVNIAYDAVDAAFRKVWHDHHITWSVAERLGVLLDTLKRELPEGEFDLLVQKHEEMELEFRPEPASGALEALQALHGKYPLAIISDAIFSPGRALRELLRGAGMFEYFDCFIFSDELGRSKPHRKVFDAVATHFGIDVTEIVHIGDRPHNDVGGPQSLGARSVLLTVVKERPLSGHTPDAVCNDYAELPAILEGLEQ